MECAIVRDHRKTLLMMLRESIFLDDSDAERFCILFFWTMIEWTLFVNHCIFTVFQRFEM